MRKKNRKRNKQIYAFLQAFLPFVFVGSFGYIVWVIWDNKTPNESALVRQIYGEEVEEQVMSKEAIVVKDVYYQPKNEIQRFTQGILEKYTHGFKVSYERVIGGIGNMPMSDLKFIELVDTLEHKYIIIQTKFARGKFNGDLKVLMYNIPKTKQQ